LTSHDGPLSLVTTWRDGCVSDAVMNEFHQRLMQILNDVSEGRMPEGATIDTSAQL
jgi:hypothetical protein